MLLYLPNPILIDIIHRAGNLGFRNLVPFIVSGHERNAAAFENQVLCEANLEELMYSLELLNEGSRYRPFLCLCVNGGNIIASYIESLRLLTQTGLSDKGLALLAYAAPRNTYARLAFGLFIILSGRYYDGLPVMKTFFVQAGNIVEAVRVADVIILQIRLMGTPGAKPYNGIVRIPVLPECDFVCDTPLGICFECFVFMTSPRVTELC